MNKKISFVVFITLLSLCLYSIPPVFSAVISSSRIAFVDVDRVLLEYDGTKEARKKMSEDIRLRREEAIRLKAGIRKLRVEIEHEEEDLLRQAGVQGMEEPEKTPGANRTLTGLVEDVLTEKTVKEKLVFASPEPDTEQGQTGAAEIRSSTGAVKLTKLELLEEKKQELNDMVQEIKVEIVETESRTKRNIMGRVYDVVKEIAEEGNYNIVLNKEEMLFGEDDSIDLTDRVIRRLNRK